MGEPASNCAARRALLVFGCLNVGLGLIGVVVPGMPTTVFLIIALWAFSKSSDRCRRWLWDHPRLGPPLRAWHRHRVIPMRAKVLAVVMMASSFACVALFVADGWVVPALLGAAMVPVAAYVLSRASVAPAAGETT